MKIEEELITITLSLREINAIRQAMWAAKGLIYSDSPSELTKLYHEYNEQADHDMILSLAEPIEYPPHDLFKAKL